MTRPRQLLLLFLLCLVGCAGGAWGISTLFRPSASAASQPSTPAIASVALGRNDFSDAARYARKAIALNPNAPEAYGLLGDAEAALGDYSGMVRAYQKMVDLKANLASYSRVSFARWLHGDEQGASRFMLMALRSGGSSRRDVAAAESQLGDLYFNSGFLLGAEAMYTRALHTLAHYPPALAGEAKVDGSLGHTSAAIREYKQALAVTKSPEYVISLGDLYAALGNKKAAEREYTLVRTLDLRLAAHHIDDGAEIARFEADHNLDLPAALRLARAEAGIRHDVMTQDTLAWALYKNGRYAEAWTAERQALRLGTHYAPFYYHAGMIQAKLGNVVEAQSYLHSALMLNSSFSVLDAPAARTELLRLDGMATVGA